LCIRDLQQTPEGALIENADWVLFTFQYTFLVNTQKNSATGNLLRKGIITGENNCDDKSSKASTVSSGPKSSKEHLILLPLWLGRMGSEEFPRGSG
jgi:hypothetical protein